MAKFRSGKKGRVTIGGADINLTETDVTYRGDDLDTTSFEDQGKDAGLIGVEGLDISFKGNWDAGSNPIDDPPGLFPRDDLANVSIFPNRTDAKSWACPIVRVLSTKNNIPVRGVVMLESTLKSNGTFQRISGSV